MTADQSPPASTQAESDSPTRLQEVGELAVLVAVIGLAIGLMHVLPVWGVSQNAAEAIGVATGGIGGGLWGRYNRLD